MPLPTLSSVHIASPMDNLAIAYVQDQSKFKASLLSPLVNVSKQSDSYFIFSKADFMRDMMQLRAPGTGFARSGFAVTSATYSCIENGLEHVMPDQIRDNWSSPFGADQAAVNFLNLQGLIRRERKFVSTCLATSVWVRDVTGHGSTVSDTSHVWWDNASADIIGTLKKQCRYMEANTGFRPNRFVTTQIVADVMMDDPDIIDRHKYTNGGPISLDAVAALCGIGTPENPGKIVVLNAAYNSAAEGATHSGSYMASDVGLLEYVAPSPQIDSPSATYTFSWSPHDQFSNGALAIKKYRQEEIESDIYRAKMHFDLKVTATDLGVYFYDLLT